MRKIYITFSGSQYEATTHQIVDHAPRLGVDEVRVYDDKWLMGTEFYQITENRWIWEHQGDSEGRKRGFGWFCWKPFVIMHALDNYCKPGDIVLYTDADTYPIADLSVLFSQCHKDGGAMFFNAYGCDNVMYCKRDCFIAMGQDRAPYTDHRTAGVARFMLFERGPWKPRQFLMEWLTYCLNPLATTFDSSVLAPEYQGFGEHRTEQAIMTLLTYKYNYKLYREACQFGARQPEDQDLYPQLFRQVYGSGPRTLDGSRYRNV
jgi:hypothetical protein